MKYIIIGQLMLWLNAVLIVCAYFIVTSLHVGEYVMTYLGWLGGLSGFVNFMFSVFLQIHGYQLLKVFPEKLS